jgi:PEP-CTERM motif
MLNFMKSTPLCTIWTNRVAIIGAAGLAACSLHAQGTISATAALTEVGQVGSEFEYSLSLDNTGNVPINAFWYGWIRGSFDLPSVPTSIAGPSGWTGSADGNSIQFGNSTGSAIAPGTTGTFTFDSTSAPTAMTTGTSDGAPTGDSIAYSTVAGMSSFDQSDPGKATGPFQPTLTSVPEPSTIGLLVTGLGSMAAWKVRRRSKT